MTAESQNKAPNVPNASRLCQLRGCLSPLGPAACQRAKNCAAADFTSFRQKPETDDEKIARLAAGFAGDCNGLLDEPPTAEAERAAYDPHSWPDGMYLCPTCLACGATQFRGPKGCRICYVCWQQGVRPGKKGDGFHLMKGDLEAHKPTTEDDPAWEKWDAQIAADVERLGEAEVMRRLTREEQEPNG